MVICAVASCSNNNNKSSNDYNVKCRYFSFPREKSVCDQWVQKCYQQHIFNIRTARICSEHFIDSDYCLKEQLLNLPRHKWKLKQEAVPSLNLEKIKDVPINNNVDVNRKRLQKSNDEKDNLNVGKRNLTRRQIFLIWCEGAGNRRAKVQHVINRILQISTTESYSEEIIKKKKQAIHFVCKAISNRWDKSSRQKAKFLSKYCSWLDKEVLLMLDVSEGDYQSNSKKLNQRKIVCENSEKIYCRLCLEHTSKNALTPLYLDDFSYPGRSDAFKKKLAKIEETLKMLKFCLPFFDSLTINPIICSICLRKLRNFYEFANECLNNQRLIEKFMDIYGVTNRIININDMIETKCTLLDDNISSHTKTEVLSPNISEQSKNSMQQIKNKEYSHEHNYIAKKQKICHKLHENNLPSSSTKEFLNIKTEHDENNTFACIPQREITQLNNNGIVKIKIEPDCPDIDDRSSPLNHNILGKITDPNNSDDETIIKIEPESIDGPDENAGSSLEEFMMHDIPKRDDIIHPNDDEETTIKIEPCYFDCPNFIKTELENDLHVENDLCNKSLSNGTNTDFEGQKWHLHGIGNVSLDKTDT